MLNTCSSIYWLIYRDFWILQCIFTVNTAQKIKFSIKDFFSKCDQIQFPALRIWSHLLNKSLMENFIFMQWNLSISPLKKCTLWYQVIATRSTSLHDFFQILFFCLGQNFFKGIYVVCFFCVLKRMFFFFILVCFFWQGGSINSVQATVVQLSTFFSSALFFYSLPAHWNLTQIHSPIHTNIPEPCCLRLKRKFIAHKFSKISEDCWSPMVIDFSPLIYSHML